MSQARTVGDDFIIKGKPIIINGKPMGIGNQNVIMPLTKVRLPTVR